MLTTSRILLRPPAPEDAPDVLLMALDDATARWNPMHIADLESATAWCERGADWSDGTHASFSVTDIATGRFAGSVSVHTIDPYQADAEIGYRTAPWARGRGYATEAVTLATAWAFGEFSLIRIELAHAVTNTASCAVASRAGYALEGVLRQSFVYGDGERYDEHLHARLASDT